MSDRLAKTDGELANYLREKGFFDQLFWGFRDYLQIQGQFDQTVWGWLFPRGDVTSLFGVSRFQSADDAVLGKLMDLVVKNLPMSESATGPLHDAFAEIMDNVRAHARSPIGGFLAAEVYPQTKALKICFTDMGIGMRESFRNTEEFASMPDSFATIKRVVLEGLTSMPKVHSGQGLPHVHEFVKDHNGILTIISQEAFVEFRTGQVKEQKVDTPIPGTTVHLDIDLSHQAIKRIISFEDELKEILRRKQP
jgi:hypothetical protein